MSALLQEAIVDATALREAALKNAEASIIEKYSDEVRNALDNLLRARRRPSWWRPWWRSWWRPRGRCSDLPPEVWTWD